MLTPSQPAPEDYYQNNCCTLLEFVLARYRDLLTEDEEKHYESYLAASTDAQRLIARLLTRKGPVFRTDLLEYREITHLAGAVKELVDLGLLHHSELVGADRLLGLLRKDELLTLAPSAKASLKKSDVVDHLLSGRTDEQVRQQVFSQYAMVEISNLHFWDLARLLFFGESGGDWSTFVLNDLRLVEYEDVAIEARQFQSRAHLDLYLSARALSRLSHEVSERPNLSFDLLSVLSTLDGDRFILRRRDRSMLRIAQNLERQKMIDQAIAAYGAIPRHPARERHVRLLHKSGREEEASALLEQIKRTPLSEEEAQFAERFGQRNKGFQPETFEVKVEAIDSETNIETQALECLATMRGLVLGAHVENTLVRTLTGLIYWPVIFLDIPGAFTNPFQSGPNDLYSDDFVDARKEAITSLERDLSHHGAVTEHLEGVIKEKWNKANGLVSWSLVENLPLSDLVDVMPESHIRALTSFQIRRLPQFRTGLPDLCIVDSNGQYEFIEVKGPNDQLQPVQRLWFKHFHEMGIPARVMKIRVAA